MDSQNPLNPSSSSALAQAIEEYRQKHLPTVSRQDLEQTTAVIETLVETPGQLQRLLQLIFTGLVHEMVENPTPDGTGKLV